MHVAEVQSTIMIVLSPTYHARMGDCQVLNTKSLLNQANILLMSLGQTLAHMAVYSVLNGTCTFPSRQEHLQCYENVFVLWMSPAFQG